MTISTLQGKNFVITGKIAGEDRNSAAARVIAAGGHFQKQVTNATDVLIIGADVGRKKTDDAAAKGVPVITWADAVKLMNGGGAVQETAPPTPLSAVNKRTGGPKPGYRQVMPMKCKKADQIPNDSSYVAEMKWDGYRTIAHVNGRTILDSSEGNDFTERFEQVTVELDTWTVPCVLDGEMVQMDEHGHTRFFGLHSGDSRTAKFVVFDVLEAQGTDVRNQPWVERRKLLETIFEALPAPTPHVALAPTFDDAASLLEYAMDNGLEGIVLKQRHSLYHEGARNSSWLKVKVRQTQEFVVIGWTDGEGARAGTAGALLLAVRENLQTGAYWRYIGKAGSGGTYADYQQILARTFNNQPATKGLTAMLESTGGVEGLDLTKAELRKAHFCDPTVVVTCDFAGWSPGDKTYHCSIKGIRDVNPMTVVREP